MIKSLLDIGNTLRYWVIILQVSFMSKEDMLLYAYKRRYRVIGTCGGYRLQYVGFLLVDSHKNIIFPELGDIVIYLAIPKK